MQTIAVLSRKGGAGKTTVALNLALAARQAGVKVVVADVDPLHSVAEVLRDRPDADSMLVETSAGKLFVLQEACTRKGCDLLIIDTPTTPESDGVAALNNADLCLAVARPTSLDLAAAQQTLNLLRRMSCPALVVLNQCPLPRSGVESSLVERALEAFRFGGVPVAETQLRSRTAYQHAFAHGRGVTEWDPEGEAAGDVMRLLVEISGQLLRPELVGVASRAGPAARRAPPPRQIQV